MYINWIRELVVSIAAVCTNVALIECICGEKEFQNGIRLVCGAYVALAVARAAINCIQIFM